MRYFGVISFAWILLSFPRLGMGEGAEARSVPVDFPSRFVENAGQWSPALRAIVLQQGTAAVLGAQGFTLRGDGASITGMETGTGLGLSSRNCTFLDPAPGMTFSLRRQRREICRYYSGRQGTVSEIAARTFDEAWYENVWPGISTGLRVDAGRLRQRFRIAPGADLRRIRMSDNTALYSDVHVAGRFRRADGSDGELVDIRLQRQGDVVSMQGPRVVEDTLTVEIVFGTYLGGSEDDELADIDVLRDGSIVLSGQTESFDFPLVNPADWQLSTARPDLFVTRFAAESRDIVFSTFYKGTIAYPNPSRDRRAVTTEGSANGTVHFTSTMYHADNIPITVDARWKARSGYTLFRLDEHGRLLTSTYVPDTLLASFVDIGSDLAGNVYLLFSIERTTPPMVTANALMPHAHENEIHGVTMKDGFIMKFTPEVDSILYATCIGGTGQDDYKKLEVDPAGNMYVIGEQVPVYDCAGKLESRDYPIVNPLRIWPGDVEIIVTRISCDGGSIDYSTYIGGAARDRVYSADVDANGYLHIIGWTTSNDFPYTATIPEFASGYSATYMLGLTPSGALGYAIPVSTNDRLFDIAADHCGLVSIMGIGTPPLKNPWRDHPKPAFWMATVDVSTPKLRFGSAWIPHRFVIRNPSIAIAPGALFLTESVLPAPDLLELEKPLAGNFQNMTCAFNILDVPFGKSNAHLLLPESELELRLYMPDEVRIYSDSGLTLDGAFPLRVEVTNRGGAAPLSVQLRAGTGLRSLSGGRDTIFTLTELSAGERQSFTWPLSVALQATSPSRYSVTATAVSGCRSIMRIGTANVVDAPGAFYELECALDHPMPVLDEGGTRLTPNPISLRATVRNLVAGPGLDGVRCELILPAGMGLAFEPGESGVRGPFTLVMGNQHEAMWTLRISERTYARVAGLRYLVRDRFGNVIKECRTELNIPAIQALSCGVAGIPDLLFHADSLPPLPQSVEIVFGIENGTDSLASAGNLLLDLSAAPHLAFADGERAERGTLAVPFRVPLSLRWRLDLTALPVAGIEVDTVFLRFTALPSGVPLLCSMPIRIGIRPADQPLLSCELRVLNTDGYPADTIPSPASDIDVRLVVMNAGTADAESVEARIAWVPAAAISPIPPMQQLGRIEAGGQRQVAWRLQPTIPSDDIPVVFTAFVSDMGTGSGVSCSDSILLKAVEDKLECALFGPDSVRYRMQEDSLCIDSIPLTLRLVNRTDYILSNLSVLCELSPPGSGIEAPGGGVPMVLAGIAPRDTVTTTLYLRYEMRERVREWVSFGITVLRDAKDTVTACGKVMLFEGTPWRLEVGCETLGHDSIWLDQDGERFLPDPLQIVYAVRNTGEVPIRNCEVAIHPPANLRLDAAADSIQWAGDIGAGETRLLSWLLRWTPPSLPVTEERITFSIRHDGGGFTIAPCDFTVHIHDGAPPSVVVSPWMFQFEAVRNAPLPPAQSVRFDVPVTLTGGWTATPEVPWTSLTPFHSRQSGESQISVTTTDMPEGLYQTSISVIADGPASPSRLLVHYRIHSPTGTIAPAALPSTIAVHPLPVRSGEDLVIDISGIRGRPSELRLYDMLGRLCRIQEIHPSLATFLRLSTTGLHRGAYMLMIVGSERREFVRVVVM